MTGCDFDWMVSNHAVWGWKAPVKASVSGVSLLKFSPFPPETPDTQANGSLSFSTQQPSLVHESLAAQPGSRAATLFPVHAQQPPAAPATDQPTVLTSPVMEQLVSRVTEEVTNQLQSLLSNLSSMAQ